jgi:hypothetical protein
MKKAQPKASAAANNNELLALLEAGNSGAKLSLFADWAAGRDPVEVERALKSLDIDSHLPKPSIQPSPIRRKAKVTVLPGRS